MRVVFAGTPDPAIPSLERLIDSAKHDVVGVITRPDAAAGRGRKTGRSPVGALADSHGIPVLTPARPSDPDFLGELADLAPDVCPVVAYGALLPRPVLDVPKFGWINLHFSLLPAWRGAAPVQAAIAAGPGARLNETATRLFTWVAEDLRDGRTEMDSRHQWFVEDPDWKLRPIKPLLEEALASGQIVAALDSLNPTHPDYAVLKQMLLDFVIIIVSILQMVVIETKEIFLN